MDDIMEKLPDPFSMSEIMGKVEERTPYVVVAFQVILPYLTPFYKKCISVNNDEKKIHITRSVGLEPTLPEGI